MQTYKPCWFIKVERVYKAQPRKARRRYSPWIGEAWKRARSTSGYPTFVSCGKGVLVGVGAAKLKCHGASSMYAANLAVTTILQAQHGHGRLWSTHCETNCFVFQCLGRISTFCFCSIIPKWTCLGFAHPMIKVHVGLLWRIVTISLEGCLNQNHPKATPRSLRFRISRSQGGSSSVPWCNATRPKMENLESRVGVIWKAHSPILECFLA